MKITINNKKRKDPAKILCCFWLVEHLNSFHSNEVGNIISNQHNSAVLIFKHYHIPVPRIESDKNE